MVLIYKKDSKMAFFTSHNLNFRRHLSALKRKIIFEKKENFSGLEELFRKRTRFSEKHNYYNDSKKDYFLENTFSLKRNFLAKLKNKNKKTFPEEFIFSGNSGFVI